MGRQCISFRIWQLLTQYFGRSEQANSRFCESVCKLICKGQKNKVASDCINDGSKMARNSGFFFQRFRENSAAKKTQFLLSAQKLKAIFLKKLEVGAAFIL